MANRRFIDFPIASTVGDNDIVLIWQDGANKQTTKATILSGLPENLEDLNDVVISGLTNGQILRYDSVTGKWENTDQGNLDLNDLNDVSIVSPSNGQVLVYNSSTSKWENSSGGFVPYVGAVTTVDLGAQGLRAGYVRFDTSVASVPDEQGLMYWDASRSTAALIMNGTLQHIGQDTFFYVKNSTPYTIAKGSCVRFAGTDGASGHLLIELFTANGVFPSSYFMGVTAEAIASGSFGQVMHFGELTGINTSGYTSGALLYASTTVAGGFQTTVPVAPNNIVLVAAAVNSKNNGAIIVRPQIGSNINNDEGVKITSPTTGDLLQLQAGGLWENKTIDGAGIVTKATSQVISGLKTFNVNTLMMQSSGNANAVYLSNSSGSSTYQSGFNFFGFNTDNHIYFAKSSITGGNTGILAWTNTATRTYTLKDASGTLAFTSDIPANPVGGTGTTNYLPKFTGSTTIGNSQIFDNGTGVGIGTTSPQTVSSGFTLTVGDGATQQQPYLALSRNSLGGFWAGIRWYDGNTIKSVIQEDSDFNLRFSTSNVERLRITSGGNLLVGTTTDNGARLQVSGTATFSSSVTAAGNLYVSGGTNTNVGNGIHAYYESNFAQVQLNGATGSLIDFSTSGTDFLGRIIYVNSTNAMQFHTASAGTAQMTITSNGNVGIGTSSPAANLQVASSSSPVIAMNLTGSATSGPRGDLAWYNSSISTVALIRATAVTDNVGTQLEFYTRPAAGSLTQVLTLASTGLATFSSSVTARSYGINNSGFRGGLYPYVDVAGSGVDNSPTIFAEGGANQGNIYFCPNGSATRVMTINTSSNVLIGTTTDAGSRLQVNGSGIFTSFLRAEFLTGENNNSSSAVIQGWNKATTGDNKFVEFYTEGGGGTLRGSIDFNRGAGLTRYNTTSDYRLKTELEDFNANAIIKNLKPKKYRMLNASEKMIGFIAHELQEFYPQAVSGKKDQVNEYGLPIYQGIDYSQLTGLLVKAIQELKQEIDTLKN